MFLRQNYQVVSIIDERRYCDHGKFGERDGSKARGDQRECLFSRLAPSPRRRIFDISPRTIMNKTE
jgi:hypothetical protein